jgi:hypothetical protein
VPITIAALKLVRRYYDRLKARQAAVGPMRFAEPKPPAVIVATAGRSRLSDEALSFELGLSPDVIAVHLTSLECENKAAPQAAVRSR